MNIHSIKIYYIFAIVSLICLIQCNSEKILELNDSNFEEYRLKHEYVLIYFHANYSEESKFLQMHFKRLPGFISPKKDIVYAIITQKNYIVNHKYNVEFPYPKIILVNKDSHHVYSGEINTNTIADWVER